jgi:hypothetical protein
MALRTLSLLCVAELSRLSKLSVGCPASGLLESRSDQLSLNQGGGGVRSGEGIMFAIDSGRPRRGCRRAVPRHSPEGPVTGVGVARARRRHGFDNVVCLETRE